MISVQEAEKQIFQAFPPARTRVSQLHDSPRAVLKEALHADRPLPPYNRVAMDGIALAWQAWNAGQQIFPVAGIQQAGQPPMSLPDPTHCIQVMTGAVLPLGCDTVVPIEDIQLDAGMAQLKATLELKPGAHIHALGSDAAAGQILIEAGRLMLPPHWAIAASVGACSVPVSAQPKIALISTGDELVPPEQTPLPHQIRSSNRLFFASALRQSGYHQVQNYHFADVKNNLITGLAQILAEHTLLILSGGVSMGAFDFVPSALKEVGVREVFHKIRQRPGKPLWFGVGPQGQAVFGLPGNPVSAAICFYRYVLPAIWQSEGRPFKRRYAALAKPFAFAKNLTCFLPVTVTEAENGQTWATPLPGNGSGDFASLAGSDGFLELPGPCQCEFGQAFPLWLWQT